MRIRIRHETRYRYDKPIDLAAQVVRLAPCDHEGQRVLSWRVMDGNRRLLPGFEDGYGNRCHLVTIERKHEKSAIVVEGEVETSGTAGVVAGAIDTLPPLFYLRQTDATRPDRAIEELAATHAAVSDPVERLHRLMLDVRARVIYEVGSTSVVTSAAEALARGHGVCQDHAHVLIAAARLLGHPARYVSGYLWDGPRTEPTEASTDIPLRISSPVSSSTRSTCLRALSTGGKPPASRDRRASCQEDRAARVTLAR